MQQLTHSGWQVTSVDSTAYTVDAKGNPMYGARVNFQTTAGNTGSVFVPNDLLTPENVTAQINQRAAIMDTVANLSEPPETVEV